MLCRKSTWIKDLTLSVTDRLFCSQMLAGKPSVRVRWTWHTERSGNDISFHTKKFVLAVQWESQRAVECPGFPLIITIHHNQIIHSNRTSWRHVNDFPTRAAKGFLVPCQRLLSAFAVNFWHFLLLFRRESPWSAVKLVKKLCRREKLAAWPRSWGCVKSSGVLYRGDPLKSADFEQLSEAFSGGRSQYSKWHRKPLFFSYGEWLAAICLDLR